MKHGFTLLELIIVIIIIGILAVLGLTQYTELVEKQRSGEAKTILSAARKSEITYYLNKGAYATSYSDLDIIAPTSCTSTHYFYYSMNMETGNERMIAWRCTNNGKSPDYSGSTYAIVIRLNGTYYSSPTGYW